MTTAQHPPPPTPTTVGAASRRLRASSATLTPGRELPRPLETRRPLDLVDDVPPAVTRDRARWADCSRGAHDWTDTPSGRVCLHCPVHADQAERVRAARRALQGRP